MLVEAVGCLLRELKVGSLVGVRERWWLDEDFGETLCLEVGVPDR